MAALRVWLQSGMQLHVMSISHFGLVVSGEGGSTVHLVLMTHPVRRERLRLCRAVWVRHADGVPWGRQGALPLGCRHDSATKVGGQVTNSQRNGKAVTLVQSWNLLIQLRGGGIDQRRCQGWIFYTALRL